MKSLASLLALGVLAASQANPGVVVDLELRNLRTSPPATDRGRIAVVDDLIKMEGDFQGEGRNRGAMIFRGDRSELLAVDHDRKEVMVIDEKSAGAMADKMSSAMEQAMAGVPPEQRAMIEQMMKQKVGQMAQQAAPPAPTETRATARRETVGTLPCVVHEVYRGDEKVRELCVAEWSRVEGGADLGAAFKGLSAFMKKFIESLQRSPIFGAIGKSIPSEDMAMEAGFPVKTTMFENGKPVSEWLVQSVRRERIEQSAFEAPDGYRRRTMMER